MPTKLDQFAEIYGVLAFQLREQTDAAAIRAYHKVLERFDFEIIKMAADQLAVSAEFFPKTSEWVQMVERVERDRNELLRERLRQLHKAGKVACVACDDTGWRPHDVHPERYVRCECVNMRRLEVLGRRPLPGLPA